MVLYLGAFIRYLFQCISKREKRASLNSILHGMTEKTKEDEIANVNNQFRNRMYGFGALVLIVIFLICII